MPVRVKSVSEVLETPVTVNKVAEVSYWQVPRQETTIVPDLSLRACWGIPRPSLVRHSRVPY